MHAVVNSLEQHGLVAYGNTGIAQPLTRRAALRRYLIRVVEMRIDINRMIFFEHVAKFRRDSLRKYDRGSRADANHLDVVD